MRKPCAVCGAKDDGLGGVFIRATLYVGNSTFDYQKMCLSCFETIVRKAKGV